MELFGRRSFLGLAGSAGLGVAAISSSSMAFSSTDRPECLSLRDPRVARFVAYRNKAFQDPEKALNDFALMDVVYVSTSGQRFNKDQLMERIGQWNKAFRRLFVRPVLAAQLDSNSVLVVYDQKLSQVDQFRGVAASGGVFDLRSFFFVSYGADDRISRYSSFLDYGELASKMSSPYSVQLLGFV